MDGGALVSRLTRAWHGTPVATPPQAFGYRLAWFALKNATPQRAADALVLTRARPDSWKKGLEFAYGGKPGEWDRVFVTPPISGWVLAVGWCAASKNVEDHLITLSATFGEAQAFATHRPTESHQWILARDGEIDRSFVFVGDFQPFRRSEGALTPVEREFDFFRDSEEDWSVDERDVMRVADAWSLDPTTLDATSGPPELGIVGRTGFKMNLRRSPTPSNIATKIGR